MAAMGSQHHPDEDLKALNFVRRSLLRKNEAIRRLRLQVKDLQDEVQALKHKYRNHERQSKQPAQRPDDFSDEILANIPQICPESAHQENSEDEEEHLKTEVGSYEAELLRDIDSHHGDEQSFEETPDSLATECTEQHFDQQKAQTTNDYVGNYDFSTLPEIEQSPFIDMEGSFSDPFSDGASAGGKRAKNIPYVCRVCGRTFRMRYQLKRHWRYHSGEKPYPCPVEGCSYRAIDSSALGKHKRTHLDEKPYACDAEGCDFRANESSVIKLHKRRHTGERPWACPVEGCVYRGLHSGNLLRHLRTHVAEKPYACPMDACFFHASLLCDVEAQRVDLSRHLLDCHAVKPATSQAVSGGEVDAAGGGGGGGGCSGGVGGGCSGGAGGGDAGAHGATHQMENQVRDTLAGVEPDCDDAPCELANARSGHIGLATV